MNPKSILLGSGLGAAGGALIAPKDNTASSMLQGAGWGAFAGGPVKGITNLIKGKAFLKGLKETSLKEAATGAATVTGVTAVTNKLTGAYDPNKKDQNKIIRAIAPAADDLGMLGLMLLKGAK